MNISVIKFFPRYKVSDTGIVYGVRKEILKYSFDKRGYMRVWLYDENGKKFEKYIHRLVATAFVSGDTSLTVNHIDGVKTNNHYSNLEWVTNADNLRHSFATGARDGKMGGKKGKFYAGNINNLIAACNLRRKEGTSYRKLSKLFNINRSTIEFNFKNNILCA